MPELPEAETIARQLQRQLAGYSLGDVYLARADIVKTPTPGLPQLFSNRRVVRVYRRAKRVVIELESHQSPGIHAGTTIPHECGGSRRLSLVFGLGMTGRLVVVPACAEVEKHTHLRIAIPHIEAELRFRDPRRFGGVWIHERGGLSADCEQESELFKAFGVEPLTCTAKRFREVVARKRQIKALLMDQSAIAGLGNIYCDESLHAAGIHPLTRADRLNADEVARLLKAIKSVLRRAIRSKGSTLMDYRDADGAEGNFQRLHRVYAREGQPCKSCGTTIKRILAAGRSTHFCPQCQPRKNQQRQKS
jgi:formamidopyrimidine-DNA glycosylase